MRLKNIHFSETAKKKNENFSPDSRVEDPTRKNDKWINFLFRR